MVHNQPKTDPLRGGHQLPSLSESSSLILQAFPETNFETFSSSDLVSCCRRVESSTFDHLRSNFYPPFVRSFLQTNSLRSYVVAGRGTTAARAALKMMPHSSSNQNYHKTEGKDKCYDRGDRTGTSRRSRRNKEPNKSARLNNDSPYDEEDEGEDEEEDESSMMMSSASRQPDRIIVS